MSGLFFVLKEEILTTQNSTTTITVGGKELEIVGTNRACAYYEEETGAALIPDIVKEREELIKSEVQWPSWTKLPKLTAAIWAMSKAAGSTKLTLKKFVSALDDAPANLYEPASALNVVFGEFGETTFFRLPEAIFASLESDEGQQETEQ